MERLFKQILPTFAAIGAGVLTLIGLLLPAPELSQVMIRWAVIIAAFAIVLGILNVLRFHLRRFVRARKGWIYSLVLLLSALISMVITTVSAIGPLAESIPVVQDYAEPLRQYSGLWFSHVIVALEASAAALIAFALAVAAFRLMRSRRQPLEAIVFMLSALIVLVGNVPLPEPLASPLTALRAWWMGVWAMAGIRGLLIGVGLGTLVLGLRILTGLDRPHSDV